MSTPEAAGQLLRESLGDDLREISCDRNETTALIERKAWRRAVALLKEQCGFAMLIDLCASDHPKQEERFEVAIQLASLKEGARLRLKTRCSRIDPRVDSLCSIFPAANWYEREAFDLFGIRFEGHPELTRILCADEMHASPLRKDVSPEVVSVSRISQIRMKESQEP